jgi:hypothetical protein
VPSKEGTFSSPSSSELGEGVEMTLIFASQSLIGKALLILKRVILKKSID